MSGYRNKRVTFRMSWREFERFDRIRKHCGYGHRAGQWTVLIIEALKMLADAKEKANPSLVQPPTQAESMLQRVKQERHVPDIQTGKAMSDKKGRSAADVGHTVIHSKKKRAKR